MIDGLNLEEFGTMEVIVDGVPQRRPIDHIQMLDALPGNFPRYEPKLRSNEGVMHTISGKTIIYKTHD